LYYPDESNGEKQMNDSKRLSGMFGVRVIFPHRGCCPFKLTLLDGKAAFSSLVKTISYFDVWQTLLWTHIQG
jgi:hypothetical protein